MELSVAVENIMKASDDPDEKLTMAQKAHETPDEAKPVTVVPLKHRPTGLYNTFYYVDDKLHDSCGIDHTKTTGKHSGGGSR